MRVRILFFILFVLFGLPVSYVSASGLDTIGTTTISYITSIYAIQKYPTPNGSSPGFYFTPNGDTLFRRINTYVGYTIATSSVDVRIELYYLDDGYNDDDPVLVDYSDWETLSFDGTHPRTWTPDDLVSFDFGHDVELSYGFYILRVVEKNNVSQTGTQLLVSAVNDDSFGVAEIPSNFVGYADWENDFGYMPPKLVNFKSYLNPTTTLAFYTDTLVGSSTSYVAINDVYAWETDGATSTYSVLDCIHTSGMTSYYDFCFDNATTTQFVSAGGQYLVPDGDYKITYTLLDNDSLPVKMTYNILYDENGEFYYIVPLDDLVAYGDMYEFGIRICVEPEFYFDDGDTACAQVNYVMCTSNEDCLDAKIRWTENDGTNITGNETSDASALKWLNEIIESGVGRYFLSFATTTLSNTFPFSIPYTIYDMYSIYENSFSTTTYVASTTSGFYIGLNMTQFGLPTTTAGIPLSAMAQYAKTNISPELFDTIDTVLWSLFWFFVVFRVVTGSWHMANELASTQSKSEVIRERGRSIEKGTLRRPSAYETNSVVYTKRTSSGLGSSRTKITRFRK